MKTVVLGLLLVFTNLANAECGTAWEAATPLLNTAVHDLGGFGYVHAAVEKMQSSNPGSEICISGLMLSKNIYQYGQYYIQADVRSAVDHILLYRMRFLFQDASTQAFQNMNQQPWTVVDAASADKIVKSVTQDLQFAPLNVESSDVLTLAKSSQTYAAAPAEDGTLMAMPLTDVNGVEHAYLVSWLTKMDGNIFANFQQTKGVVIAVDANGKNVVAENLWLYQSLTAPLQASLQAGTPQAGADFVAALLRAASPITEAFIF